MSNSRTIPDKMKEAAGTGKEVTTYVDGELVTFTPEGLSTYFAENLTLQIPAITTAGATTIPAGTLFEVLQAIADLADPAV